jgi:predicted RecB family nuclease
MIISSELFESYLQCPTKCWLRSRAEPPAGNSYAEWVNSRNKTYLRNGLKRLLIDFTEGDCVIAPPIAKNPKDFTWRLASDVRCKTKEAESCLQAVERVAANDRGRPATIIPYRFEPSNKITKEHKLLLTFDALMLSESLGTEVNLGKVVHGDNYATMSVNTLALAKETRKRTKETAILLGGSAPPELVLNRHCGQCEFQNRCLAQAKEKNDLSLLSGISEKDRKKLHAKGIFTVTQLSYTFRPRRRRRESRGKQEKHHHSLRALAIRENTIHAVGILDLKLQGTSVFLDVEGLPDRDFYYLIGVRFEGPEGAIQHSLWADNATEEGKIWTDFLDILSKIADPQLIHYGSYEAIFLRRMCERHGGPPEESKVAIAVGHPINLLSFIYAQVYFQTYSNGLKDITGYLGFQWSGSLLSGLDSIAWRDRWEVSGDPALAQALVDYNRQDSEALEFLAKKLIDLHHAAPNDSYLRQQKVVLTSDMKRESPYGFKTNQFVLPDMETINKAAYWDYQRERVYVKSRNKRSRKRERIAKFRDALKPNTTIEHTRRSSCPKCKSEQVGKHGKQPRTVVDLRFTRCGIRRWITRHSTQRYRCGLCKNTFYPLDSSRPTRKYGSNLVAYLVYLMIELRLPMGRVTSHIRRLFHISLWTDKTHKFKADTAEAYRSVYDNILTRLCGGKLLHVDETSVSVQGKVGYVWVLTSIEEVAYFYTPTREGSTIQTMLKEFSGVLVSDFYAAYDAVDCPQQKCLIHFIRDLNDDLLKHPYDDGLKLLASEFTAVLKPIVDTVDRRGLRKRFLGKHKIFVDRFYKRLGSKFGSGEVARKIVERLQRNRDTMFTFLSFDDVPWNNNNAEHAVKAFATLRHVIDGTTTENGLRDYLVLLSICETCKYRNLDFLDFLRCGSKSIDAFANRRRTGASDRETSVAIASRPDLPNPPSSLKASFEHHLHQPPRPSES